MDYSALSTYLLFFVLLQHPTRTAVNVLSSSTEVTNPLIQV